jgi:hypothetical protein
MSCTRSKEATTSSIAELLMRKSARIAVGAKQQCCAGVHITHCVATAAKHLAYLLCCVALHGSLQCIKLDEAADLAATAQHLQLLEAL